MITKSFVLTIILLSGYGDAKCRKFDTPQELVQHLRDAGCIKSEKVAAVMSKVDKNHYISGYYNTSVSKREKFHVVMSGPYAHAYTLETLKDHLKEGSKVLDVASGSGYLTVCLALMVGETGRAIGVDDLSEIVEFARKNVEKNNYDLIKSQRVLFVCSNGRLGVPDAAPFDVIHVGAYVENYNGIPPNLIKQLKKGGRMMIPVENKDSSLEIVILDKDLEGNVKRTVENGTALRKGGAMGPLRW